MHGVWHAIAAYYQNPFDNKILSLLKIKNKKPGAKYLLHGICTPLCI